MDRDKITEARDRMWDEIDDVRVGMLGLTGSDQHLQPMTAYTDREANALWFISASDTDLVRATASLSGARYVTGGKDGDFWVDVTGRLSVVEDQAKLDELWNAFAAAWFKDGKESPRVTLLRMDLSEAAIWMNEASKLGFLWEVAKANLDEDETPDVGSHVVVEF